MKIKTYVSRHVVPFYYESRDKGYEKICESLRDGNNKNNVMGLPKDGRWIETGFWEDYKSDSPKQGEMELYTYFLSVFKENSACRKKDMTNLGTSFVYKTNGKLFEFDYLFDKEERIPLECKDFGILVLKNGTGFLWYEIEFKKVPKVEQYIHFQHDFKESARTHTTKFERKVGYDNVQKQSVYEPFCVGKWIIDFVDVRSKGIHFWAERISGEGEESPIRYLPDKALLFQYLFIEKVSKEEHCNLVFRVANGYDMKYKAPDDIESHTYSPFGNTYFYISKAGMACVVTDDESNKEFFEGQFKRKFNKDYFFLYILLCYQSYTCAHYSRLLTKMPAEEKSFGKRKVFEKHLESLNTDINLFLVKSIFDSISNVHHQNEVYRYGKNVLCINDDIQSLTIGLESLRDIEKDKHDTKVNNAISIFGMLVVISALLDGANLVDLIVDSFFDGNEMWRYMGYGGVAAVIVLLAIYLIAVLIVNNRKNK